MDQAHHAVRDSHGDSGGHQRALPRPQFDIVGAEEVDTGVAVVGPAGQRELAVQANHRKIGEHGGQDYP